MLKLRGVFCPLATPFNHQGELYPTKVRHNVGRLNRTRIAGLEVAGPIGEGFSLTAAEKTELYGLVAEAAEEKTLLAAVDSGSLAEAVELAVAAKDRGYSAVTARAPEAGGRGDELLWFLMLADRSALPVLAGTADAGIVPALAAHPNIAGVADDSADGAVAGAGLSVDRDGFDVLAGSQSAAIDLWEAGVRAFLLPLANAVPFHLLSLEEALRTRELDAASELSERAEAALEAAWRKSGPAGLKAAMDLRSCYGGSPRTPVPPATAELKREVEASLAKLAS